MHAAAPIVIGRVVVVTEAIVQTGAPAAAFFVPAPVRTLVCAYWVSSRTIGLAEMTRASALTADSQTAVRTVDSEGVEIVIAMCTLPSYWESPVDRSKTLFLS